MREAMKPGLPTAATAPRTAGREETAREFGGTFGAAFIMTLSHALMLSSPASLRADASVFGDWAEISEPLDQLPPCLHTELAHRRAQQGRDASLG